MHGSVISGTVANAPAATFKPTASQRCFWPLNKDVQGRNLVSGNGDFVLRDVGFSAENEFMHASALFNGMPDSYGEILNNNNIQTSKSFSWIGAVNRKVDGDGAFFEWDNGHGHASHIWIFENKLFTNVKFLAYKCDNQVKHSAPIVNNKWHVLAVSYSMESRLITMWVDGEREENEDTIKPCADGLDLSPANNVFINHR